MECAEEDGNAPLSYPARCLLVSSHNGRRGVRHALISQLRIGEGALLSPPERRFAKLVQLAWGHARTPRNSRNWNHYRDRPHRGGPGECCPGSVLSGWPAESGTCGTGLDEGFGMNLRRAALGLIVGTVLMAPASASAGPALVFEPYNGTVFYAEDPDAAWFPASLTKLMTAYVAFQALKEGTVKPESIVVCSKKATEQAPSKLWLKEGESITLDIALKVLIVKSANDVAMMIAETVSGSEEAFVARMNEEAKRLNMTRTVFANVNGLPDERQVTTARDLAKLARAIIIEFPEHADLFTAIQVQVGKQLLRTHNGLLVNYPGADGMKTGFI